MAIVNIIAFIILCIGGHNWGLVGIFKWNLVNAIFAGWMPGIITVYILVLIATLWLIFAAIWGRGKINFCPFRNDTISK